MSGEEKENLVGIVTLTADEIMSITFGAISYASYHPTQPGINLIYSGLDKLIECLPKELQEASAKQMLDIIEGNKKCLEEREKQKLATQVEKH